MPGNRNKRFLFPGKDSSIYRFKNTKLHVYRYLEKYLLRTINNIEDYKHGKLKWICISGGYLNEIEDMLLRTSEIEGECRYKEKKANDITELSKFMQTSTIWFLIYHYKQLNGTF